MTEDAAAVQDEAPEVPDGAEDEAQAEGAEEHGEGAEDDAAEDAGDHGDAEPGA